MNILKFSVYYYPEQISSAHLTYVIEEALIKAGHKIIIIAPMPSRNVPDDLRSKYRNLKVETKYDGALTIRRFRMFKEGKNPLIRAIRYILCNAIQYIKGCREKNIDLLFAGSTPPTQGVLCGKVKKKLSKKYGRKIPLIYNLQDVFPDSLVSAGMTSQGSLLWRLGRKIENYTYSSADKIIVISNDIKKNILSKGVPANKIDVIPNWINTDEVHHVQRKENGLFDELGIDSGKFILVYAGNLGSAQGIDTFIEAAKQIDDIEFVIFGDGSSKDEYKSKCDGKNNIHMFPLMPMTRVSEVYSMSNISLVACKKGMGSGAVPSKTFSIMASATPVLLNFDTGTELWNLIESNNCGICTSAGNVQELVNAMNYAKNHPEELLKMGVNARKCVENTYCKEIGTNKIIKSLTDAVEVH